MSQNKTVQYRSGAERSFAQIIELLPQLLGGEFTACEVLRWTHEALRFNLGGHWYKPDFLVTLDCPGNAIMEVIVEVKGTREAKGYTRTRQNVNGVAALYPEFVVVEAIGTGSNWQFEIVSRQPFTRWANGL